MADYEDLLGNYLFNGTDYKELLAGIGIVLSDYIFKVQEPCTM